MKFKEDPTLRIFNVCLIHFWTFKILVDTKSNGKVIHVLM